MIRKLYLLTLCAWATTAPLRAQLRADQPGEMHITDVQQLAGGLDITCEDAYVIFDTVRPETLVERWSSKITINGAPMVADENARVAIWKNGSMLMAHGRDYVPLTTFTSTGEQQHHLPALYYTNQPVALIADSLVRPLQYDNAITGFHLRRGYMATLACESDGTGYSRCFVADTADVVVQCLPAELSGKVSFVRVFRWNSVVKKGWVGSHDKNQSAALAYVREQTAAVNGSWFYNWGATSAWTDNPNVKTVRRDAEFVPEKWGAGGEGDWQKILNGTESAHLNGYNEPDHSEQSDVSVSAAVAEWPRMLQSGQRLGSPATTNNAWLFDFVRECRRQNYRVDYVCIHAYWGGYSPGQWYSELKKVHDATGLPIWITEWNNGANWTKEPWPSGTDAQQQQQLKQLKLILEVLDTCSFVERYSIYNWVEDKRALLLNGKLTPAGEYYAADPSDFAWNPVEEYIPRWEVRQAPTATLHVRSDGRWLRWNDPNGEQLKGHRVLRRRWPKEADFTEIYCTPDCYTRECLLLDDGDLTHVDRVEFRVESLLPDGQPALASEVVGYDVAHPDVLAPLSLTQLTAHHTAGLTLYAEPYAERRLTLLGTPTYRIKAPFTVAPQLQEGRGVVLQLRPWVYQGDIQFNYPDTLACAVTDAGRWTLEGGMELEVDSVTAGTEWKRVTYRHPMPQQPVVVAQVMHVGTSLPHVVRVRNVTTEGFELQLQVEEAVADTMKQNNSVSSVVSWMAAMPGTDCWNGHALEVGRADEVGDERTQACTVPFVTRWQQAPAVFASWQDDSDPYASMPRVKSRSATQMVLIRDREKSASVAAAGPLRAGYVVLEAVSQEDALPSPRCSAVPTAIYDLRGRYRGTSLDALPKGVYVRYENGVAQKCLRR